MDTVLQGERKMSILRYTTKASKAVTTLVNIHVEIRYGYTPGGGCEQG